VERSDGSRALAPRSLKQLRSGDVLTIQERDALLAELEK